MLTISLWYMCVYMCSFRNANNRHYYAPDTWITISVAVKILRRLIAAWIYYYRRHFLFERKMKKKILSFHYKFPVYPRIENGLTHKRTICGREKESETFFFPYFSKTLNAILCSVCVSRTNKQFSVVANFFSHVLFDSFSFQFAVFVTIMCVCVFVQNYIT